MVKVKLRFTNLTQRELLKLYSMAQNVLDDWQVGWGIEVDAERFQIPKVVHGVVSETR